MAGAVRSLYHSLRETLTPLLASSAFASEGVLTPAEFVAAGDALTRLCPSWHWEPTVAGTWPCACVRAHAVVCMSHVMRPLMPALVVPLFRWLGEGWHPRRTYRFTICGPGMTATQHRGSSQRCCAASASHATVTRIQHAHLHAHTQHFHVMCPLRLQAPQVEVPRRASPSSPTSRRASSGWSRSECPAAAVW